MRNDIENPRPDARYMQIGIALILGTGLAGSLLLHALDAPSDIFRWLLFGGWVVLLICAGVFAYRNWERSKRNHVANADK
jgi:hypothetical protein